MPTPTRPPRIEPFAVREGRLFLEDVELSDVAAGLHGREAWLISHAAVDAALEHALSRRGRPGGRAGGARTVAVAAVGPRVVLAQCAAAGCWARVASSHELDLAREAGFDPRHIVAGGAVVEDGFLRDALAAGVAVIERLGRAAEANLVRIATALGHALPGSGDVPADLPATLFASCGGLLAPLLAGPPALALDAVWEPAAAGARARAVARVVDVLPLTLPDRPEVRSVTARGLGATIPTPARLHGPATRGRWVLLVAPGAAAVHRPDPSHPLPSLVMVRGAAWRLLNPRRLPAARDA